MKFALIVNLASATADLPLDEINVCVPDGDCLADPYPARVKYEPFCSKTGHWTLACAASNARCGAAFVGEEETTADLHLDEINVQITANSSVTCTATNKCELRGASCCDPSDHGTAACSRTWCETKCLAENVVKHCSSKEALCEAIGMGPEDPLADLCAAVWGGICVHHQQHETCERECGKLDGKRCGSANVLV